MDKFEQMNQDLLNLNQKKDEIIEKMKSEISNVLLLKDEIPKILQLNQVLSKKLKERDEQIEHFASLAKTPEEYDEIESAIKELQDSLDSAKQEI